MFQNDAEVQMLCLRRHLNIHMCINSAGGHTFVEFTRSEIHGGVNSWNFSALQIPIPVSISSEKHSFFTQIPSNVIP